ncbi:SCA7-domain-containing protein [Pluteus cervinus]|uniref:SCA7-domain-containing protein n=1 Tax=Pluteus cervinus TaxID=181527 RepID=A0ACD3B1G2_9AGAR|nr:SCA7-domain-containing protein [Pluteus cervinus]
MAITLKKSPSPASPPFSWDALDPPSPPLGVASPPSPPTSWLSARDMKLFGPQPLTSTSDIGVVRCKECDKPILRSFISEHAENCATIRAGGKKGMTSKLVADTEDPKKNSKKRKASPSPSDPSLPPKKKAKPATKVTKGRVKGPVDYDRQCGVINDKGLPCSRSLTCKSHSMGAKRAVQGRSKLYDELLLEWQRANNPNFVEPVKRETKAEKKEKREREKLEKKREAAAALGVDPSTLVTKKSTTVGSTKKVGKKAATTTVKTAEELGEDPPENLDDLDSEAEVDELVRVVRSSREKGIIGVPLAVTCDAGSWFVQRRERARCCRDLLLGALGGGAGGANGFGGAGGMISRSASSNLGAPVTRPP